MLRAAQLIRRQPAALNAVARTVGGADVETALMVRLFSKTGQDKGGKAPKDSKPAGDKKPSSGGAKGGSKGSDAKGSSSADSGKKPSAGKGKGKTPGSLSAEEMERRGGLS